MNAITKITLKLKEREIELTADEAKQLHKELDEIYGKQWPVYIPTPMPTPYPVPVYPSRPYWEPTWVTTGGHLRMNENTLLCRQEEALMNVMSK